VRPALAVGRSRSMRIAVVLVAAGCLLASSATASPGSSGLFGHVMRGPVTPVCTAEAPCSAPAAGVILVFSLGGKDVARTRVRSDGSYRLTLAGGTYAVRAIATRPIDPHKAWVRAGHFRKVDFAIDTGIR
jgi:hypothetical protein